MTDAHKSVVTRNIAVLSADMKVEDILGQLLDEEILDEHELKKISTKATHQEKAECFLLEIFLTKPDSAFDKLVSILYENKMNRSAQLLEGTACL